MKKYSDDVTVTEEELSTAPAIVPEAKKATAEQWAEGKSMLPRITTEKVKGVDRLRHNPNFWKYAAARAFKAWPLGVELTEAEFDAAVEAATTQVHR